MRLGNYSVLIPTGREHGTGHVGLPHGSVYQIKIGNHGMVACDAEVEVDGKSVGCFRLDAYQSFNLERPADDTGRFTFFRTDSVEGQQAGEASIARDSKGLVRVIFKPAKKYIPPVPTMRPMGMMRGVESYGAIEKTAGPLHLCSAGPQNATAGVTGLTGTSAQTFTTVPNLDYDLTGVVEIALRLVCDDAPVVRPLQPQVVRSTGIPSAL